jgi:mono/diheme cytochrome c family protein
MNFSTYLNKRRLLAALGVPILVTGLVACPGDPEPEDPNSPILTRESKSSAIAISSDDKYTIQVNPENDSITVLKTSDNSVVVNNFNVGDEPVSVVVHPDNTTAFVALRAEAKIVKINNFFSTPSIASSVNVGSEPTGIALSPRGDKLVVAEFAESRVALVDTKNMSLKAFQPMRNPRAVAVTNNKNFSDKDEKIVVTEFYGRVTGEEATDNGRTGAVRIFKLTDLSPQGEVLFPPAPVGKFLPPPANVSAETTQASPNQLASVAIVGDKFFATAVAAAPDHTPTFTQNVFPFVLIGQISTPSKVASISLADEIESEVPAGGSRNFMADLYDLAPVSDSIIYLLGRGADAVQRIALAGTNVELGASGVKQIDLLGAAGDAANPQCQNPIGIVARHDSNNLFVDCWVSRAMLNITVSDQKVFKRIPAAPIADSEKDVNKGRRDYFTARARWSKEVWSSCGSCHPDGLSDNITWSFPSGPRQSTSMDGTFSHGPGAQKQRILNWTGIFDEIHDFERNTRTVSGGLGAVVKGCNPEERIGLNPNDANDANGLKTTLLKPVKEIQDETPSCVFDFDSIENFVKTIRPPKKPQTLNASAVDNGKKVFEAGNCQSCHGGAGWTVSRRFFTPKNQTNLDLSNLTVNLPGHQNGKMIENERNANGEPAIGPNQVACVLRPVGTFGAFDPNKTAALEVKQDASGAVGPVAQGQFAGYNVPSLYGLSVGAPFLHHGQASTLAELLGNARWSEHLKAGNKDFNPSAAQLADLEKFLVSIDANTPEIALPANADLCPAVFPN